MRRRVSICMLLMCAALFLGACDKNKTLSEAVKEAKEKSGSAAGKPAEEKPAGAAASAPKNEAASSEATPEPSPKPTARADAESAPAGIRQYAEMSEVQGARFRGENQCVESGAAFDLPYVDGQPVGRVTEYRCKGNQYLYEISAYGAAGSRYSRTKPLAQPQ